MGGAIGAEQARLRQGLGRPATKAGEVPSSGVEGTPHAGSLRPRGAREPAAKCLE